MLEIVDFQKAAEFFMEYGAVGFCVALLGLIIYIVKTFSHIVTKGLTVIAEISESNMRTTTENAALINEQIATLREVNDSIRGMSDTVSMQTQEIRTLSDRTLTRVGG